LRDIFFFGARFSPLLLPILKEDPIPCPWEARRMDASAQLPALPEHPEPAAELVVIDGRLGGARRALSGPLTLVGQGVGCDLRLLDEGVALIHCAVVRDADGPLLRDLGSPAGTRVNGQTVGTHRLANGDRIEVGGVTIEVSLETPTANPPSADVVLLDRERDGLRIQAAAVIAQQAALDEVETRLDGRQVSLERQETQLARHLDDRRRELDVSTQALDEEREAIRQQRDDLAREKAELVEQQKQFGKERQRLKDLPRKLMMRSQEMGKTRESSVALREAEADAALERCQRERATVQAFQERVNGELELGRLQLRDQRQALERERAEHLASLRHQQEALHQQQADLTRQVADLGETRQALAGERQAWEARQATLVREVDGLESRIRNTRPRLDALTPQTPRPAEPIIPPPMSPALQPEAHPATPADLRDFADMLDDQRRHLLGQWRQLIEVEKQWQEEHRTALAELELVAEELAGRESDLVKRQRQTETAEMSLVRRLEDLTAQRASLDGWRSRFAADEAGWKAKQESALDEIAGRESLHEQRRQQFEAVQQRRNERRKQEVAERLALRARCEEASRNYLERAKEIEARSAEQEEARRDLAARAIALEQVHDELVHASADPARTANSLEKLRKRERARLDAEARALDADRRRLQQDLARLEADSQRTRQREAEQLARQADLARRAEEWEAQRSVAEEEEARRQEELRRLRARHAVDDRQLRQLREELERLARLLIEDGDAGPAMAA
jgi:pSer/pThr/pTyr-binding forkhead associated (FHA) protein